LPPALRKIIYPFLLPNGLLCLLLIFFLGQDKLPSELYPLLGVFPYLVVVIGVLLGWRFNRTRLIWSVLLLLLFEVVQLYAAGSDKQELMFLAGALLLPLNLLFVSWFKERGLLSLRTAFWLVLLFAELLGTAWLLSSCPEQSARLLTYQLFALPDGWQLPSTQPLLLINLFVLFLFFFRMVGRGSVFEASFFWAQVILLAGFSGLGAQPLRLYLAGAGLILILGIMETSYSLAYRDELTGLPGRRALNEELVKLGNRYTMAMLDIDHFKKFNDTHGHDVGDQVLRMVAGRLAGVSGGGKVFRYGGEEFSVIFPRKSVKDSLSLLEDLRNTIEEARFIPRSKDRPKKKPSQPRRKSKAKALKVTISIGAAERSSKLNNPDAVIKAADRALYRAKKQGRNRVCS